MRGIDQRTLHMCERIKILDVLRTMRMGEGRTNCKDV